MKVPVDVFNTIILPYSYKPQMPELRNDLYHYLESKQKISSLYHMIWHEISNEGDDIKWLAGDLIRYFNHTRDSNLHNCNIYFWDIMIRHYSLKSHTQTDIGIYMNNVFCNYPPSKQFNIIWGILYPCERERFLLFQQKYVTYLNMFI
jgi:hypothetical protein